MQFGKYDTIGQLKKTTILKQVVEHFDKDNLENWDDLTLPVGTINKQAVISYINNVVLTGISPDITNAIVYNEDLCIGCGLCTSVCPMKILTKNSKNKIDWKSEKCISCGRCFRKCPALGFVDQTDIISSLKILKDNSVKRVAIIAPSIASQFSPASFPQIVTALKKIGFDFIVEAAHGADLVLQEESKELVKKGKLISSCCPSFVNYISSNFPNLKSYISTTPSPTIAACDEFKNSNPNSKFIFISPCAAKKLEFKTHKGYIDTVLTFEEISAIFEARKIECETLEETELNQATYWGRIFAYTSGIVEGVKNFSKNNALKTVSLDGIEEVDKVFSDSWNDFDFFGGMICKGGCINGMCVLHQSDIENKEKIISYAKSSVK